MVIAEQEKDWNTQVIEEFRANAGRVGGEAEDRPMLLLHHIGAKSRTERVTPLVYQAVDGSYAIFASNAGRDTHPAWYYNLVTHPNVTIEVGSAKFVMTARVTDDEERALIWARQKEQWSNFADYEAGTSRQIPVLLLEPTT